MDYYALDSDCQPFDTVFVTNHIYPSNAVTGADNHEAITFLFTFVRRSKFITRNKRIYTLPTIYIHKTQHVKNDSHMSL